MASVTLDGVSVVVERTELLRDISLWVPDGEVVAVLGPSGSGKSTLLRVVAGLARAGSGHVRFDGVDVTGVLPGQRDAGMVFQEPALLPNRSVQRNVAFPLEIRRELADAITERVGAEARALHIEHLLHRNPAELSRGEEQLVQIARALVRMPSVLLLDEPFSALDEPRRQAMRAEIALLQAGYGTTTLIATNDPADALALAHRVVVLAATDAGEPGRIAQLGRLAEVRDEPATLTVAMSLGELWPIPVEVQAAEEGAWLVSGDGSSLRLRSWAPTVAAAVGRRLTLGVRTGDVVIAERGAQTATVVRSIPGAGRMIIELAGRRVHVPDMDDRRYEAGDEVAVDVVRSFVFDEAGLRLA
ncbi:MAG: ABC transporter ATP-binding protein [Actinomycetota bacterium]